MADVIGWVTSNLLAPVASGAVGVVATLWRTQTKVSVDLKEIKELLTSTRAELIAVKATLEINRTEIQTLQHKVSTLERDLQRQSQTTAAFLEDQGEQWLDIQRTLGQIEGQIANGPPTRHPPPRRGLRVLRCARRFVS